MKHFFYMCFLFFLFQESRAQVTTEDSLSAAPADTTGKFNVTGTVTSAEDSAPLPGVRVSILNNETISATTDANGIYSIDAETSQDTLVFTLAGKRPQGIRILGKSQIDVTLENLPDSLRTLETDTLAGNAQPNDTIASASGATDTLPADTVPTIAQEPGTTQTGTTTGQLQVSGTVRSSEDGEPIPGANVVIKNTSKGVVTDINGKYTIQLNSPQDVLAFSFVGMKGKELPVNGKTTLDVVLDSETEVLKEVVVVGYGTMDRATLTSSVSTVGSDMIEKDPLPSVTQAIQGKAGGVQVTQRSGSPGGGVNIRIRGTTSINASADPLYVVDGIPVNSNTNFVGGSDFNFGGGTQGINILSSINPSDIESVEVLKDAAASAIYGARAANGVVLITTKRGKANTSNISINTYAGVSSVPQERLYDLMNTAEYISYMQDYYQYKGTPVPESILRTDVDTDWQNEIFRTAPMQNYEIAASGGSEKTQYYTSLGYYDQRGTILNSGFERFSTRLNVDHQHSEKLKFSTNINLTRAISDRVQEENSRQGSTKNGITSPPNLPVYNGDGTFAYDPVSASRENPVAMLLLPVNTAETFRILASLSAEYTIVKGLSLRSNLGIDMSYIDESFFMPPSGIRAFAGSRGLGANRNTKDQLWINENLLTYNKTLGDHSINVLGGISVQESKYSFVDARRSNFASNEIPVISAGGIISGATATAQEWAIVSYFARLNYGFKNRYLLTANFRTDGSSRFGEDNRYGSFPSFAAAWRITEEPWMNDITTISNLKIRASWGLTGNQNIPNYASYSLYSAGSNYSNTPGFTPTQLGYPELGWESTEQLNFGIDLGLFEDRISLLADYYVKNTSDLLINIQVPRTTGFQTTFRNIGEIQNKGFEFELTTKNLVGDLRWNTSLNMTFNRNEIRSLPEGDLFGGLGNLNIGRVGYPIGTFYGWKMVGVNPETGMVDFLKMDGSVGPPSDPADKTIIGNPNPDFFGGITNTFFYKGIDLSIMGQFSYGNDIFNYNLFELNSGSSDSGNGSDNWNRRWRQPGDITDVPRPTPSNLDNATISDRFVEDGSFFRIRNITLGYTLPSDITERLKIKSLRVYGTVQNLYVFTNYSGYDPEVSSAPGGANPGLVYGFDYGSYPQPRIITGGINLTF